MTTIVVCLQAHAGADGAPASAELAALAFALALPGERQIIALLAGSEGQAGPLHVALAMGATGAARVAGNDFATVDFHTLGRVLAGAAKSLGADLILCGARADSEGLGALSASLARHIGYPHLANVEALELGAGGAEAPALIAAVRGGGQKRRLGVSLPVVMSIAGGPARPEPPPALSEASAIRILTSGDPDATVVRRRTEILGTIAPAARDTSRVTSAADLMSALLPPPPADPPPAES